MKTLISVLLLSVCLSFSCFSEEKELPRTIEISGTATVKAEVDRVAWNFSIRGEGPTLAEATAEIEQATNRLDEAISGLENNQVELRFSRISSGKVYETVEKLNVDGTLKKEKVLKGFFIQRSAVIRSESLEVCTDIESILLGDDRVQIGQLNLTSSLYEDLKKRAVTSAVEAAKEKAEGMVAVFPDLKLGPVLFMQEGSSRDSGAITLTENRIEMPVFNQASSTGFDQVSVTTSVLIKIELQ
ncbi:MAG: SIMPL domain-containing protein [Verrucomicrobiota bacterium]